LPREIILPTGQSCERPPYSCERVPNRTSPRMVICDCPCPCHGEDSGRCAGCKLTKKKKQKARGFAKAKTSKQTLPVSYFFGTGQWQRAMRDCNPDFVELVAEFCGLPADSAGVCVGCLAKFETNIRKDTTLYAQYQTRQSRYQTQRKIGVEAGCSRLEGAASLILGNYCDHDMILSRFRYGRHSALGCK
jgi:hypothetical protein